MVSAFVWSQPILDQRPGTLHPLADAVSVSDLDRYTHANPEWYDYSTVAEQCQKYKDYARILGYCEIDFINGLSGLRGNKQVLMDIGSRDSVYLDLVERRFEFVYNHLRITLEAAQGEIEFIHLGEDLGSQQGMLLSTKSFREIFGRQYREIMDLAHAHGARTMMHVCGSVVGAIPMLIELGLDVLDVVQTNAVGMDLDVLKREFGRDLSLSGTMCVQKVIPFGTPAGVSAEV